MITVICDAVVLMVISREIGDLSEDFFYSFTDALINALDTHAWQLFKEIYYYEYYSYVCTIPDKHGQECSVWLFGMELHHQCLTLHLCAEFIEGSVNKLPWTWSYKGLKQACKQHTLSKIQVLCQDKHVSGEVCKRL